MIKDHLNHDEILFITGCERRLAKSPRRADKPRRHRIRFESDLSDCRSGMLRRHEDEEGFIEIASLYNEA
ncbi:MAG: hypothetical protein OEZ38_05410 [Gammaproteobacteria bacterium]|nr:hypothetical protein [Gammaproteobacteria bacterium]